jgi:hypothetical protein
MLYLNRALRCPARAMSNLGRYGQILSSAPLTAMGRLNQQKLSLRIPKLGEHAEIRAARPRWYDAARQRVTQEVL